MWTRRSQAELELHRRKISRAFGQPVLWALLTFILMIARFAANPGTKGRLPHVGMSLQQALLASLWGSLIVGVLCYVWQLYWRRRLVDKPTWICSRCHAVKHAGGDRGCHCGGTFEDIDRWKWSDD